MLLHNERNHNMKKEALNTVETVKPVKTDAARNKFWKAFRDNLELLLLTLPGIVLCFLFNYLPMFGVVVAFKKFSFVKALLSFPINSA